MKIYIYIFLLLTSLSLQAQLRRPFRAYSFDNTLADSSGNGATLKAYGNATFDGTIKAVGSHSGIMDGNNDYWRVPIGDLGSIFFTSYWLRSDNSINSVVKTPLTIAHTSNYFYQYVAPTDGVKTIDNASNSAGTGTWSAATWHHVVFAYRKSDGRARIYIDGARVAQSDSTISTSYNSNDSIFLGVDFFRNSDWDGNIDEVRFYTGYLPSEAQIDSLYNLSYKNTVTLPYRPQIIAASVSAIFPTEKTLPHNWAVVIDILLYSFCCVYIIWLIRQKS